MQPFLGGQENVSFNPARVEVLDLGCFLLKGSCKPKKGDISSRED